MAHRPVIYVSADRPFYREADVEFKFNAGFSAAQKRRNIAAVHEGFLAVHPDMPVLEISSKSMQPEGLPLSAFFLKKYVPSIGASVPVECVFQSSKAFENGGPYTDLLFVPPIKAKRDERLRTSGALRAFIFEDREYPLLPRTSFYDYIYLTALSENEDLARVLMRYRAFTDIEFNPAKSLNCQARAAAVYVSLALSGNLDCLSDYDAYIERITGGSL